EYGDLSNFLKSNSNLMNWALKLKIAKDIASGMLFLHSARPPIIHRDLKSPNVLVCIQYSICDTLQLASQSATAPVVAKVADFGKKIALKIHRHCDNRESLLKKLCSMIVRFEFTFLFRPFRGNSNSFEQGSCQSKYLFTIF